MILITNLLMSTVNSFFSREKEATVIRKSIENPNHTVRYWSVAEYYEDKCDYVLKMKFPTLAKFFIKLTMIFSEIMIIAILIIQGLILAFQQPNILLWGFLIFSLTL